MARTWLSIRVELVSGMGVDFWPRPGRDFAAAGRHTFANLGFAIDSAFARWDHAHLNLFTLDEDTTVTPLELWDGEEPDGAKDSSIIKLSTLKPGQQFAYVFNLGDEWQHLCTVAETKIDPAEHFGELPPVPVPYWGWGNLPDQYGRQFDGDDGDTKPPAAPKRPLQELPPILPSWGPRRRGPGIS